ncbi:membrane bound O-acyl transferase family-domain-containing protein [Venturia nashicola]|nr:membrane bound O-acyl transferase family-domain-containing protein [Venturia nashicola]
MLCNWFDRVVLQNPDKQKWHKTSDTSPHKFQQDQGGKEAVQVPQGYWERLSWSFQYTLAIRGVGWSHQVKNVPQAPPRSYNRWKFVVIQLLRTLFFKLVDDSMVAFASTMPFGGYWGENTTPQFFSLSLPLQLLCTWMFYIRSIVGLSMATSAVYTIAAALGIWAPHELPPMFGDVTQAYTVRKSWSDYRHLMMRRIATTSGLFFARDMFNLKPGTFASRYVQLYAGFFATGFTHSMGSIFATGHDLGDMRFFLLQAIVIMIEDHAIAFGRDVLGIKANRVWKVVGFCWFIIWTSWSRGNWYGPQVENGFWVNRPGTDWLGVGTRSEL